ncbi:papain-like cysteine protease family protein [Pseudomonas protegens]|uniref:papain-like cysteine protease family protein n=1 Tax=Pseudomonas protegens TaxID=380021 RepID=UPI002936DD7A|nr:papain-like cysteine protease family protein [Pseudomonas protegens]WOE78376.1 papain-like cysteine protease family protein [Pseudomonas protegens]
MLSTTLTPTGNLQALPQCLAGTLIDPQLAEIDPRAEAAPQAGARLNFSVQPQTQSNWCWAALSASVGNYYGTGSWTQCGVANAELGRNSCCSQPGPCNVYGYLDSALRTTRSYGGMRENRMQMPAIENQLGMGRPVGLRCAWYGGGAHFLTIYGTDGSYILVADSIFGYSTRALNSFPGSYNGGGNWTHTYFTRKN